MKFNMKYLRKS